MIEKTDILSLHFFDYKMAFTGSYGNMRYRIVKVEHELEEDKKEVKLLTTIWAGPYAYDHTEEEKENKEFEFSEEGKNQVVDWLNEQYILKYNKSF